MKDREVIFIIPRSSTAWRGAEALWITVAGWSMAAKRLYGNSKVYTLDRVADAEEVLGYPLGSSAIGQKASSNSGISRILPLAVKQFLKDINLYRHSRRWKSRNLNLSTSDNVVFIWEQHDLYPGAGARIARELKVPLVMYVHAPVVWEMEKWGVKRYFWGRYLERFVERRSLLQADVVACVSTEVAEKVKAMGIDPARVMVSPMAVDESLFAVNPLLSRQKALELGIGGNDKVIGWTGSFRSFHGLDILVRAFATVLNGYPNTKLLLVGDGKERSDIELLIGQLGIRGSVIFAGRQEFKNIPHFVSLFDVAVVSARSADGFHYFPLKLKEYLVAGKATLAPRAGDIPSAFEDGRELLLYRAGDEMDLKNQLVQLLADQNLRERIGHAGRLRVLKDGTWRHELDRVRDVLSR